MITKDRLFGLLAVVSALVLTGCSAMQLESLNALSEDTPENAPKGYHTFKRAQKYENEGDLKMARYMYCNAADLGHPEAPQICSKYSVLITFIQATQAKQSGQPYENIAKAITKRVCKASQYGSPAQDLCSQMQNKTAVNQINLLEQYGNAIIAELNQQQEKINKERFETEFKNIQSFDIEDI